MSAIKIGIDATNIQAGGGVTHLREVLTNADLSKSLVAAVHIWCNERVAQVLPDRTWLTISVPEVSRKGLLHRSLWQLIELPQLAKTEQCNLLFVPGGGGSRFKPTVTMSRNMLPFDWRELSRYGLSMITLKLAILRFVQIGWFKNASGLIFLTNHARNVVTATTGTIKGKVTTIPHGVNSRFMNKPRTQIGIENYSLAKPYRIVYVSAIEPYKHHLNVIDAIGRLRHLGYPLKLIIIGGGNEKTIRQVQSSMKLNDPTGDWIEYHGSISYETLANAYTAYDLGVFASSCENLPNSLIELMASGLPIASSHYNPMPEILGTAAEYFDPISPDSIFESVRKLVDNPNLRNKISIQSYEKSKRYSWSNCAKETFKFLEEIALSTELPFINK